MSGICGIVRFDGQPVKTEEIQSMINAMKNRANDTEGVWVDGNAGFGHKMFWTTPESLYENQPQMDKDERIVITADARIDNREELIHKLGIDNYGKTIITDVHLILLSYKHWGDECSKYLQGDFVLVIWDKKEKKLFIARDRFGIRPFYFIFNEGQLYFSSYIDVLLTVSKEFSSLNHESIKSFIKFSSVKYEETMYKHILRIPPAYNFTFSINGIKKERYWFPEKIKIDYDISLEDASKKVRELLFNAVKSRVRIYGQWGCELSGGLDSSAVTLMAQQVTNKKFKTFSMRYRSYNCDEWEFTSEVIHVLKNEPIYYDIDNMNEEDDYNMYSVSQLSQHWPANGAFIPNYKLGQIMINHNIRVCLTGQGGDHIFTGTNVIISDYLKNFKLKQLFDEFSCSNASKFNLFKHTVRALIPKSLKRMMKSLLFLYQKKYLREPEDFTTYWNIQKIKSNTFLNNLQDIVGRHYNMYADNNHYRLLEMNENIEFRHPFLDTKLVEYVLSLPNYYKYSCSTIKIILREALKDIYPDKIYKRENKSEFSEVLFLLMNSIDIKRLWEKSSLLNEKSIDVERLNSLLLKYEQKIINETEIYTLWKLTCTAFWLKEKE